MADQFDSFAKLAAEKEAGVDYRIRSLDRDAEVVILAPHGGTIEPVTELIAESIAGADFSFYAFEGLKPGQHSDLHITSHRFDEPRALDLVGRAVLAVALHGRRDDGTETVWLGGRATAAAAAIGQSLRGAGFDAGLNQRLPGLHATNICNRTRSGQGVQLELPMSLRRHLAQDQDALGRFCRAVKQAL